MGQGEGDVAAQATGLLDNGEWEAALALLRAANVQDTGDPDQLRLLASAAYGAGDYEGTIAAWEAIHATRIAAGDRLEAAEAAAMVAMYLLMDSALMAPVRGWLGRVDRLLEGVEDTPVHALATMIRAYERLLVGAVDDVLPLATRAIELGDRHGVAPASTLGRTALARQRIFVGDVDAGLDLLDEVAVTLMSGEVDPLTSGMVWCELVCAMLGMAQYDRAAEWTEAMDRLRTSGEFFGGINGRCRVHRAEMLRLRGSCAEAEDEALHACEELRPWMRREFGWPLTELGTIRLRRGDLAGAEEAFTAAQVNGWDPQPGLALLRLAQGDEAAAVAMIRNALEHPRQTPSKERPPNLRLTRAPLLEAQAQIAAETGDATTAGAAADELTELAEFYRSQGLRAAAALARARAAMAAGDAEAAARESRVAADEWAAMGLPYEVAMARLALAAAHRADGRGDAAEVEEGAAVATLRGIGAAVPGSLQPREVAAEPEPGIAATPGHTTASTTAVFRRDGQMRVTVYGGEQRLLKDLKGMRYLARLLEEPSREFHVLDLVAVEHGTLPTAGRAAVHGESAGANEDAGAMLDDTARVAYQRRLAEIDEDIAEAEELGDVGRAELARHDREFIVTELSRAFGIGGRRRSAVSTSERARGAVTRAIRYALDRIGENHPALAEHLERTVQTGTYCCYSPDPRAALDWET